MLDDKDFITINYPSQNTVKCSKIRKKILPVYLIDILLNSNIRRVPFSKSEAKMREIKMSSSFQQFNKLNSGFTNFCFLCWLLNLYGEKSW